MANGACERLIGTIRRECLDWMIPISEAPLRSILRIWGGHYNSSRPPMALGPGVPDPPPQTLDAWSPRRHPASPSSGRVQLYPMRPRGLAMAVVKSRKREFENPGQIEVQGIVALKVIPIRELYHPVCGLQIEMRPDIEALKIVERLPQSRAAQALSTVLAEQHVPHLYAPFHGHMQDSTLAGDTAYCSSIGCAVRCLL